MKSQPGFPRTRRLRQRDWREQEERHTNRMVWVFVIVTSLTILMIMALDDWLARREAVPGCVNEAGWISCTGDAAGIEGGK